MSEASQKGLLAQKSIFLTNFFDEKEKRSWNRSQSGYWYANKIIWGINQSPDCEKMFRNVVMFVAASSPGCALYNFLIHKTNVSYRNILGTTFSYFFFVSLFFYVLRSPENLNKTRKIRSWSKIRWENISGWNLFIENHLTVKIINLK